MHSFIHKLADGIEQYSFPSEVNPDQRHFIDRDLETGEPWQINLVNGYESLSIEQARTLAAEIASLIEFADKLNEEAK